MKKLIAALGLLALCSPASHAQSSDALVFAKAKTCADYQAFVAGFPNSSYVSTARAKIAQLCLAPKPAAKVEAPAPTPVVARAKPSGPKSELGKWFCANLKSPFDPSAAFKTFPLDASLPAPTETRETDKDGETTWVELTAEGDDFTLMYRYAIDEEDKHQYGFGLSARHSRMRADSEAFGEAWLREFGEPKKTMMGQSVGAGPVMAYSNDEPFTFETWTMTGIMIANWFDPRDVRYAKELCGG
jgi:hypothetical protein